MLEFKTEPDNLNGAAGTQASRFDAVMLAERHVPLIGTAGDDPDRLEWVSGRIGDEDYLGVEPQNKPYLERRMFAIMYARSCALHGENRPLAAHWREFEQYIEGHQSFLELLYSLKGWSLDRPLTDDDVLAYF